MKKLFKKTWFQILFFGILLAGLFIIIDEKFDLFDTKKVETGTYNGPITVDKNKTYFTEVSLSETIFDFGKVKEGDTLSHVFKMTNKGKEPLIIYKSVGTCDCVGAGFSKEMTAPGKEIQLTAYFNTNGRKGPQNRTIVFTCNTEPAEIVLTLKADVE